MCGVALVAAGCSLGGPAALKVGRGHYNVAVQQTNAEQLLLNLVRLRYRDTPFFLEVASVSTSFAFQVSGDASADLPRSAANAIGLGAGVSASEEPTVTYTPLQGEQFVRQLLSPVEPSVLLLLYHSGWSVERVFRVCVQSLGPLRNAPSASGPTPDLAPEFEPFIVATHRMRVLQKRGALELAASGDADRPGLVLRIAPRARDWPEARELVELLGAPVGTGEYLLRTEGRGGAGGELGLVTRSLMASFFYVSQGVEVPEEDVEAGRVTLTLDAAGQPFDWKRLTGDLLRIRSSWHVWPGAYARTHYRGSWFYIDDADLESKSTFSLLSQLFALQAGSVPSTGPILTLPVAR